MIRSPSKGQSCIKPSIKSLPPGIRPHTRFNGPRRDHGIDMNLSAEKRRRKCPYGSIWRGWVPMVTAAAALMLAQAGPAPAAASPKPFRIDDLFGSGRPRLRGSVHSAKIPLPQPRPAEAPQRDNAKAAPAEPEKTAEP